MVNEPSGFEPLKFYCNVAWRTIRRRSNGNRIARLPGVNNTTHYQFRTLSPHRTAGVLECLTIV